MYLEHYGLKEPPFSITPDPRFVFLSERHRDALAHLLFGIDKGGGGGFVQLTGEVGTGKTTLCRLLLQQLPLSTRVALVLNPRLSPTELLQTICEELDIDLAGYAANDAGSSDHGLYHRTASPKRLVDALNVYLLGAYGRGLRVVLIIDEAQDLSIDALEQVRLLTNLETHTQKLLQVILLGQPELREKLARADLRQLAQRITARFHLTPLDAGESERYLRHRYAVAGGLHLPFDKSAIRRLHVRAGGVPRLINVIAERSLLAGYARDLTRIDARLVDTAANEALPVARRPLRARRVYVALAVLAVLAVGMALAYMLRPQSVPVATRTTTRVAPVALVRAAAPATTKPAETPAPPIASLDAHMLAQRIATGDATALSAWQSLLATWQLPTLADDVSNAARCEPVLATGVYCLLGHGNLDMLSAIDRPVLLSMHSDGQEGWALLLGADTLRVRLKIGEVIWNVPRIALQGVWTGDYAAVWRAPSGIVAPLIPGHDDAANAWLREHLASDAALAVELSDNRAIADAVRDFQAAHGLPIDRVIGSETLFALAARDPGPHLLRKLD